MKMTTKILPLKVEGLEYSINGLPLLGPINLEFRPGTKTLIIGPNGAGKSLLLRLCHGLLAPSKGAISWQGVESRSFRQLQSFVFQHPIMLNRTAAENVEYPLKIRGIKSSDRHEQVYAALQSTGLTSLANRSAQQLSGGEKQKLALARSWVIKPEVLFLDEPTASLDPKSTQDVEQLINAIHKSGTKIIMTSHDFSQVRRLADEICFIHKGKVIEHASANEILDRPNEPTTQAYLNGDLLI